MTDDTTERDALRASLEASVKDGYIQITGERDREPIYALTEQGTERVHHLLGEAFNVGVKHFAANAAVAEWMARDLLISYAVDLKQAIEEMEEP